MGISCGATSEGGKTLRTSVLLAEAFLFANMSTEVVNIGKSAAVTAVEPTPQLLWLRSCRSRANVGV